MAWTLPLPLLLFAGVVALLPLARLVRRPVSLSRVVMEVFITTLAVIAVFCLGWLALWLIEQPW